ncbi:hypothetical protein HOC35_01720 [Candidatus Woesearchaeota archaeon]|jgi:hypothetical protein|nr:hypothetical protein [Candidatus Woesearchaeota archaeon]
MAGKTLIADLPELLAEMLDRKASEMMIGRTAVVRMAIKSYCEVKNDDN